jgi:hypothetical protein
MFAALDHRPAGDHGDGDEDAEEPSLGGDGRGAYEQFADRQRHDADAWQGEGFDQFDHHGTAEHFLGS